MENKKIELVASYHFYAAHRNQTLTGTKCASVHGHTYYVDISMPQGEPNAHGVTLLFEEADKMLEPLVKSLDHTFIISKEDWLLPLIQKGAEDNNDPQRLYVVDFITSLENLAKHLYERITNELKLKVNCITLRETTSKVIKYYP